ncbi:MAG: penicillin-insensitive murein endopeptidase, partial [Gammaproteobacteria bacterium]
MVAAKKHSSINSTPAKELFGHVKVPAQMKPQPYGSYAKGCLAGAERLPATGSHWQAMRLSRNRYWGHPRLIAFIERFANTVAEKDGWPGLLVGDLSQPRGGPMLSGHASHQIGMDVDIWLNPMPNKNLSRSERENISAVSVIKNNHEINPKVWTTAHAKLLRQAALEKDVARIFINPAIKKQMCRWSEDQKDRSWLRKLRPWYGHHYHFHVRLKCPKGATNCKNQNPPPPGTGCG